MQETVSKNTISKSKNNLALYLRNKIGRLIIKILLFNNNIKGYQISSVKKLKFNILSSEI